VAPGFTQKRRRRRLSLVAARYSNAELTGGRTLKSGLGG
jgi:hypothetical protein